MLLSIKSFNTLAILANPILGPVSCDTILVSVRIPFPDY